MDLYHFGPKTSINDLRFCAGTTKHLKLANTLARVFWLLRNNVRLGNACVFKAENSENNLVLVV